MHRSFGQTFDSPAGYLDTATIGLPTRHTAEVMRSAIDTWARGGWGPQHFVDPVARARRAFADLVGAEEATVATGASVSSLVALPAAGAPDGTRVLVAEGEYTSVFFPFAAHADRGVVVDEAPLAELPALAAGYDVVAVSAVQSADGRVADLGALRRAVGGTGCRVIVDVTQAAGWLPLDLAWADAVVGAGYKWLLAPRGVAWMALRPDYAEGLRPLYANWSAGDDIWASNYGLPMRLAADARRFDTSPAWFCHLGAASVLPWLAGLDRAAVHEHCVGLADSLCERLGLSPAGSAIVSVPGADVPARLDAAGVSAARRASAARVGFHVYNTMADVDRVVAALS